MPTLMMSNRPPSSSSMKYTDNHENTSSLGLVALCSEIEIEGKSRKRIGLGGRCLVVYVDDEERWRSEKLFSSSPLRWQKGFHIWLRPSSDIRVELFCKSTLSMMLPNKGQLLGRFCSKLVQLLGNDAVHGMTDDTGTRLDGIKMKIKLALISNSPRDITARVDAAISRIDDGVFSQLSKHIDISASITDGGHPFAQAISSCIPSLGQTFQAMVKIARMFGDTHPILKVSCTILFSMYEALKDEQILDEFVRALAESLREMVYAANDCPNLRAIEGAENVIEAIGRVSLQITSLIDEYTRLPFVVRGVRDMMSDDMKQRIVSFQTRCEDLMAKFNSRINRDTNFTVHQIQNTSRLEKILEWLKAPDPSPNYNNARERHYEGTCLWFLTGKNFVEWKESTGSLLWVYGIPGCGKTVLCSSAIKDVTAHCVANPSCAIAYFFFDSRDAQDGLQRHDGLIRCLIKQLALQCNEPQAIERLLGAGSMQPSSESLHAAIEFLLAKFNHTYVIVDSLDESTERWKVLYWLQEITRWEAFKHNTHLLITSRDEIDIRESIKPLGVVEVCMEGKAVDNDIRMYLDWTLRTSFHMKRWEDARKQEIQQKVSAMSQGMFRLAALQLEELRNCHSVRELKTQLDNLPRSLDDTYNRILSKLDEAPLRTAWKLLPWLAFSARFLRLKELAEVVGVDLETRPYPKFCADSRFSDPQSIMIICTNLISVSAEGIVQLAHFSVKEFLLSMSQRFGSTMNANLAHSLIAQTCLAYLLQFDTLEILTEDTLDNFPLAQYAAEHWVSHAKSGASDSDTDPLQALIHAFFTGNNDAPFISWVHLHDLDDPWFEHGFEREPRGSRLYYASLAGFQDVSLALLEAGADPNTKGADSLTVLQVASREGQYRTVQHLLAKGAEVNVEERWNGSALNKASARGHGEIVRLLLANGADPNVRSGTGWNSALQVASLAGHEEIVRLLLEEGANIHLLGGLCNSALHAASKEGHDGVVRILLESGAEVDMPGEMGVTALHEAAENGFIDVVKLLLEKGAQVNKRGGCYGTALQAASVGGYEDIVRLLLDNGADVGIQGGGCGSALQAAASGGDGSMMRVLLKNASIPGNILRGWDSNVVAATLRGGHMKIVKMLLENGAQINVQLGGQHGSALGAASFEGHEETVRLLLEKGAEVNAENEKYGTALQAAALEGHVEIVSLLMENGAEVDTPKEPRGSALQAAASKGHESIVRLLLEKGAEVDRESKEYGTALQAASESGHELIVQLLLEKGAEVNKHSKRLGDALQMAARRGHEHVVRLLLDNGADVHIRGVGSYGSALQAASERKHQEIVELLLKNGAVGLDDDAEGAH